MIYVKMFYHHCYAMNQIFNKFVELNFEVLAFCYIFNSSCTMISIAAHACQFSIVL